MKSKILFFSLIFFGNLLINPVFAKDEKRKLPSFSGLSLRISGTVHLKQGNTQSVEISAKSSALEELITEVKDDKLIIRFPNKNFFWNSFNPGNVDIYITIPEIDDLVISGSGNIVAQDRIKSGNLNLAVSGSGDIKLADLKADRVKASISGSGDIVIENGGPADDLNIAISGSGDVEAENFEARNVEVRIAGSGNCSLTSNGAINARIAGSGDVYYRGKANIESSFAGSGRVKKM